MESRDNLVPVCRVAFTASPTTLYSYFCDGIQPEPGDTVVVPVGKDNSPKLVTCVDIIDEPVNTTRAVKSIIGFVIDRKNAHRFQTTLTSA